MILECGNMGDLDRLLKALQLNAEKKDNLQGAMRTMLSECHNLYDDKYGMKIKMENFHKAVDLVELHCQELEEQQNYTTNIFSVCYSELRVKEEKVVRGLKKLEEKDMHINGMPSQLELHFEETDSKRKDVSAHLMLKEQVSELHSHNSLQAWESELKLKEIDLFKKGKEIERKQLKISSEKDAARKLDERETELKMRENTLVLKENELCLRDREIQRKEDDMNRYIHDLNKKKDELFDKECFLFSKMESFRKLENEIDMRQQGIASMDVRDKEIEMKEDEINRYIQVLNKKKDKLYEKECFLFLKKEKIKKWEIELEEREKKSCILGHELLRFSESFSQPPNVPVRKRSRDMENVEDQK